MKIVVIDGQGGRMGSAFIDKWIKSGGDPKELIAVGTNAMATSAMMKAGAVKAATGENPVVVNTSGADFVVGPIGIIASTEGHLQFHPREREDCGYVLTLGGTRVYIAGDSEPTPEMRSLEGIDIAFLPVNQPYTMTVDQAAEAVRALRPAIFYPYHYGEVEQITDLDRLAREVAGLTEMRVRPME